MVTGRNVIKIKIQRTQENLERQGIIKIHDLDEVERFYSDLGDNATARNVRARMKDNKEVLIEGEIPSEVIGQCNCPGNIREGDKCESVV